MNRRQAFAAAVAALGTSLAEVAQRLGVSYNHLALVLDGTRRGGARLETGIREVLDEAKPLLTTNRSGRIDVPAALGSDPRRASISATRPSRATAIGVGPSGFGLTLDGGRRVDVP